eukprot:5804238-Prymnesium_polylepis.1
MVDDDEENCLYTVDNIQEDDGECYLAVLAPGRSHRARASRLPPAWVSPSHHAMCAVPTKRRRRAHQPD